MTKTPSTMQLMKLGMDAEIREAGSNVSPNHHYGPRTTLTCYSSWPSSRRLAWR
jgi:hypothetical protein